MGREEKEEEKKGKKRKEGQNKHGMEEGQLIEEERQEMGRV